MGARWQVAVIAGVSLASATAWADQEVRFGSAALVVRIPDDWTAAQLAFQDGFEMFKPGEALVGSIVLRNDTSCDALAEWSREHHPFEISVDAPAGWTGRMYTRQDVMENRGDYCRDATIDGTAYVIAVDGREAELPGLMQLVDAGLAAGAAPRTAGAERTLELPSPPLPLAILVPDDWETTVVSGHDAVKHGDGREIADVILIPDLSCGEVTAQTMLRYQLSEELIEQVEKWVGLQYDADGPMYAYCREIEIGGSAYAVNIVGFGADIATLVTAYSAALDAYLAVTPNDSETTYEITLTTLKIGIQVPRNWRHSYNEGYDYVLRAGGATFDARYQWNSVPGEKLVFKAAASWQVDCATAKTTAGEQFPGWSSVEVHGHAGYCHDASKAYVQFEAAAVGWVLTAIAEALERRRIDDIPTPYERFGPNRGEFGLGLYDEDPSDLFSKEGWGVAMAIGKTPWRDKPGLTWSYQARLAATSGGYPGSAEAGAGLNLKVIAVQAIAGFGAAGDLVPLAVHAGAQLDLLYVMKPGGGFDFSVSRVWRDDGKSTRIAGGFMIAGDVRGYAMSFGYESRLGTSLVTINIAVMRLPDL